MSIKFLFLLAALVCFVIAAFRAIIAPASRIDFVPLGFACIVASVLFT